MNIRRILHASGQKLILLISVVALLCTIIPPLTVSAIGNGDGLLLYGEGSVQTPRWRSWTNSTDTYGAESSLPTVNGQVHQIQVATAPNRQEAVAVVQNDALLSNSMRVFHYNGTTWTADWQTHIGFNNSAPRFDVVYSQSSNKAFVVYSGNAQNTNELRYRTFDGTTWSAEQNYDAVRTSNYIAYVKAVARPGTDEIAVIWGDDSNMDMSANYFNMATGTWSGEPAAALSTDISRSGTGTSVNSAFADLAFEQSSGELLACWGNNNTTDLMCVNRTAGTSGTWGSVTTYSGFAIEPVEMHLASEPGTDYIGYTAMNDAGIPSGEVGIWNGSSWVNIDNYSTSLNSNDASTTNTAIGWVRSGSQSRAIVTFDDRLVSGVDWRIFNKNTGAWATQTPFSTAPTASNFNDRTHKLIQNPYNPGQLMFLQADSNDDLFAKKIVFDGSSVTWSSVEGGAALEATLPGRGAGYGWQADFAYYDQNNSPSLTYEQSSYRLFTNADSTDVGSALAAQNTAASLTTSSQAFRLRQLVTVSGGTLDADAQDFKLQFAGKGAGSCSAPSGTPSSYTDVTTSTAMSFNNNATPTSDSALTPNAGDPTANTNQTYVESNNFTSRAAMTTGQSGLWDFALYPNSAPAATTYCFRIVKSSGTALGTYTNYAEVSTASNQAPNTPASLAQKKTDDTTISTGGWTSESSVKLTASVSDPDSSDTLQLCVEMQPLATSFTGSETCGTGVAYSGTPVTAQVTISGLSDGTEYHWQARVKDAASATSSWSSYGGNAESARDVGVDTTAPTGGTVYDGTSAGVDATFNDNSLSSLSANWSGFNANASGLSRYDYSIGTTPGGTDVKAWTSNGTSTSVTATGLTLQTSQAYYTNVRAVDNAGNVQSAVSSDGQLVLPSLSFGVSSSSIDFGNLNAGNNYTSTQSSVLTTSTNAYGGYVVRGYSTGLIQSGSFSIPDFNGGSYAAPDSWQSGDLGFGYTSSDTSVQGSNLFQGSPCLGGSAFASPGCYAPFSHSAPGDIIADHVANVSGSPISNEAFTISYRVTTSSTQAAAIGYNATIIYSVTPKY